MHRPRPVPVPVYQPCDLPNNPRAVFMVGNVGSYDGPLFRLVRPSDRATCDVFERSAALVYFTYGVAQALSTWLPAGVTPKVQIWYDQTMGGFDARQTDYAAMPTLNWSERWLNFRTMCFLRLPDGTLPSGNAPFSVKWDGVSVSMNHPIIITQHGQVDTLTQGAFLSCGPTLTLRTCIRTGRAPNHRCTQ